MELADAILVFLIENYLKLYGLSAPICSLWKYYSSSRHVYIIVLELILTLALIVIMFASLSLVKMDCKRIANYFMVPLFLGLAYFNIAYYHRGTTLTKSVGGLSDMPNSLPSHNVVDTIELTLSNGLGLMAVVQMAANLFSHKLAEIIQ